MDHPNIVRLQHMACSPFRALHALVDFFAPWQAEASPQAAPDHPHTLDVAHRLRQSPPAGTALLVQKQAARRAGSSKIGSATSATRASRNTAVAAANQCLRVQALPLRVIRSIDQQIPATASGRMVISGRMADVCAELERLADAVQA